MFDQIIAVYGWPRPARLLGLLGVIVVAGVGVLLIGEVLGGPGGITVILFAVIVPLAVAQYIYLWLWRFSYRAELTRTKVVWFTALRSGAIPLTALREVRRVRWSRSAVMVVPTWGRGITLMADRSLPAFLYALKQSAPQVEIRVDGVHLLPIGRAPR